MDPDKSVRDPRIFQRGIAKPPGGCDLERGRQMKKFAKKVQNFLVSEDGPTAVEYAVMLALIIIVCLAAISAIGSNANTTFSNVAQSIGATN